jgi:hypothetical protein
MSKVRTLRFSYAKMSKLRTHRKMSTISNDYSFPIQTSQNCVLDRNVHHINHYTFPIQTCQNCVLITNVHYISHSPNTTQINSLHIPIQTCQNCVHAQLSTNSTLHFPYQNKPKLRHTCYTNKCPLYQYKSLHIYHTNRCPLYQLPYMYHTKQMSTISITAHFLYKQAKIAVTN